MKEKTWNILGVIVGCIAILAGILFFCTPSDSRFYCYKYLEDVSFGADFYTHQYEATRIAAESANEINRVLTAMYQSLIFFAGIVLVIWGLLTVIKYGKLLRKETFPVIPSAEKDAQEIKKDSEVIL